MPASPTPGSWRLLCAAQKASGFLGSNVNVNMHRALTLPPPPPCPSWDQSASSQVVREFENVVCLFVCILATFAPNLVILRERQQRNWSAACIEKCPHCSCSRWKVSYGRDSCICLFSITRSLALPKSLLKCADSLWSEFFLKILFYSFVKSKNSQI